MNSKNKIFNLKDLSVKLKVVRKEGKKIGFVEGVFDVLHLGHIELMEFAKKHCDILVVGVASDKYVRSTKGKNRPIFKQMIRCRVLSALSATDYILKEENPPAVLESRSSENYLHKITKMVKPDVIIVSGTTDRNPGAKKKRAKEIGARFIIQKDPRPGKNSSTTQILGLINQDFTKTTK